jgi:hypothetical protein
MGDRAYHYITADFGLESYRKSFYNASSEVSIPLLEDFTLKVVPDKSLGISSNIGIGKDRKLCILMNGCPQKTVLYAVATRDIDDFLANAKKNPERHIEKYYGSDVRDFDVLSIGNEYHEFFNHLMRNSLSGMRLVDHIWTYDDSFTKKYMHIGDTLEELETLLNKTDQTRFCDSSDFDRMEKIIDINYESVMTLSNNGISEKADFYSGIKGCAESMHYWKNILKNVCKDADLFAVTSDILYSSSRMEYNHDKAECFLRYVQTAMPTVNGTESFSKTLPRNIRRNVLHGISTLMMHLEKEQMDNFMDCLYASNPSHIVYLVTDKCAEISRIN